MKNKNTTKSYNFIDERNVHLPLQGGILGWYVLPLYQDLVYSALPKMMISFVENGLKLRPNGTLFIYYLKDSLNIKIRSKYFLQEGDIV
jgi:hypothetical protein